MYYHQQQQKVRNIFNTFKLTRQKVREQKPWQQVSVLGVFSFAELTESWLLQRNQTQGIFPYPYKSRQSSHLYNHIAEDTRAHLPQMRTISARWVKCRVLDKSCRNRNNWKRTRHQSNLERGKLSEALLRHNRIRVLPVRNIFCKVVRFLASLLKSEE